LKSYNTTYLGKENKETLIKQQASHKSQRNTLISRSRKNSAVLRKIKVQFSVRIHTAEKTALIL
jgi:hypothetical protein